MRQRLRQRRPKPAAIAFALALHRGREGTARITDESKRKQGSDCSFQPNFARKGTHTMTVVQATNQGGIPIERPGVYNARILSTEEAPPIPQSKWDKGLPREAINLRINGPEGVVEGRDYITLYPRMGKRTKGYSLFSAALYGGNEIPEGEALDTEDLLNKRVQIVVKAKPDNTGNMVDSYLPWVVASAKSTKAPVAVATGDDEDDDLADA